MPTALSTTGLGDQDGTYFERHENYERRLREGSHRWAVRRMVEFAILWRKRFTVLSNVINVMASSALLGYATWFMIDSAADLVLLDLIQKNAILAGASVAIAAIGVCIASRVPICVIYLHSTLLLAGAVAQSLLIVHQYMVQRSPETYLVQSWNAAPTDARDYIQRRYNCCGGYQADGSTSCSLQTPVPPPCLGHLQTILLHQIPIFMIMDGVIIVANLITIIASVQLARTVSKQSIFFL